MAEQNSSPSPPSVPGEPKKAQPVDPGLALSECLYSQYALTATGVASGTAYALAKKPRNGLGIMIVAGVAGNFGDLVYGFVHACRPQVKAWYEASDDPDDP